MMPKQTSGYMAQLSPNQPIKIGSRKKQYGSQPNTPKKAVAKLKPVLAIKVDEVRKELQFCMDIHKHVRNLKLFAETNAAYWKCCCSDVYS